MDIFPHWWAPQPPLSLCPSATFYANVRLQHSRKTIKKEEGILYQDKFKPELKTVTLRVPNYTVKHPLPGLNFGSVKPP